MLTKEKVLFTISKLPESFSLDDLVERMIVLEKIEKGLKDSEEGNTISEQGAGRENGGMAQIRWTNYAVLDLKDIFDYIARDSKKYANHQT